MRLLLTPALVAGALALPLLAAFTRPGRAALGGAPPLPATSAAAGAGSPGNNGGAASLAFPFPVTEKTLPNGLRVYVVAYDSPGLVAYYSVVRTGSRNEVEPGKSGFAHFFEHMMFHGTQKYPLDAYNAALKQMGADSNAFTSDDLTVYHILAGKDALPKIVELESDRFQHLQYAEPDFQKEARAVLGEYNKNASNPVEKMIETLYDNAFTTHTYKHTTMGFLKDIENMPHEMAYSRQFFDRYYRPENVVILVVGDADAETVFKLVQERYGDWKAGGPHPGIPVEPPQKKAQHVDLTWPGPTLPMLVEGYHTPGFSTKNVDLPTLDVLAELLFSERAPLYKRLVIKEQKVESLSGSNDAHVDPNLFTVFSRIKKPADIAYVEQAIQEEMARVAKEGVDEKLLAEVLSHVKYAFAGQLSTADKTAYTASSFLALTGELESINAYFALYDRVTSADVQRVAATYFKPTNRTVVTLKAGK
ncbi:MAG TPA: pitrilysin family protein [Polyangia bacterium]|nr:pitrilysin family protein [Polyangia bacterium]